MSSKDEIKKVIDVKSDDWLKGFSKMNNYPAGGLFQGISGTDPFEQYGVALPSLSPTGVTVATTPKFLTNWNDGSNGYVYAHTDTKLYKITKDSPFTVTDVSTQIDVTGNVLGAIINNGKYIYANGTQIRCNALPVASGTDVQILSGFNGTTDYIPFCVGPDKVVYFGQNSRIGKITNYAGTSSNTNNAFSIDNNYQVRDIVSDGRYLIIIADNNQQLNSANLVGNYGCRIYFWNTARGSADIIYDIFGDSYLIAAKRVENNIYIFGYKGIYVCNSSNAPAMIRTFIGGTSLSQARPMYPSQTAVANNTVYWTDGSGNVLFNPYVFGYGNPISGASKIFTVPYQNSAGAVTNTALAVVGNQIWQADNTPKIWVHNVGSTRGGMSISTIDTPMDQTYRYGFTKVVLAQPLASGQTVSLQAYGANGQTVISTSETKTYSATNPKQNLIFARTPNNPSQENFESLSIRVQTTGGAIVQRITTYATPLDDNNEIL